MNTEDVWKDIVGFEGYYQVNSLGNIKSLDRTIRGGRYGIRKVNSRILKQTSCKNGYVKVVLRRDGKDTTCLVHRLIANAFMPNPDNLPQVNHIDGNKKNNQVLNLEWSSAKYNMKHAYVNGLLDSKNLVAQGRKQAVLLRKSIAQYSLSGELITTFKSGLEAALKTNIPSPNISEVCNQKRKTAGGFIWKYI